MGESMLAKNFQKLFAMRPNIIVSDRTILTKNCVILYNNSQTKKLLSLLGLLGFHSRVKYHPLFFYFKYNCCKSCEVNYISQVFDSLLE